MIEVLRHPHALRARRAIANLLGSLSTLSTIEFPAVAAEEPAATRTRADEPAFERPQPTYAFGSFGVAEQDENPLPPTQAEREDMALIKAAAAVKPLPKGQVPPLYSSQPQRPKRT